MSFRSIGTKIKMSKRTPRIARRTNQQAIAVVIRKIAFSPIQTVHGQGIKKTTKLVNVSVITLAVEVANRHSVGTLIHASVRENQEPYATIDIIQYVRMMNSLI